MREFVIEIAQADIQRARTHAALDRVLADLMVRLFWEARDGRLDSTCSALMAWGPIIEEKRLELDVQEQRSGRPAPRGSRRPEILGA